MKRAVLALLVALLAISLTIRQGGAVVVDEQARAERFFEVSERASEYVEELRDSAREAGLQTSESDRLLSEGRELLRQARELMDGGRILEGTARSREAMLRFSEAIRAIGGFLRDSEDEETKRILAMMERQRARARSLEGAVVAVPSAPRELVEQVKMHLDDIAENHMRIGQEDRAVSNRTDAQERIARAGRDEALALEAIRRVQDWRNSVRQAPFLERFKAHLESVSAHLERAKSSGVDVSRLESRFSRVLALFEQIRQEVESGQVRLAQEHLNQLKRLTGSIVEELSRIDQQRIGR